MNRKICVSAPGKLILLGEHAAVYGKPAIIASVDKRCFVILNSRKDNIIEIISENFNTSMKSDEEKIISKTEKANHDLREFIKTNDIKLLKSINKNPLDYAQICIGETLKFYKKKLKTGFSLKIKSEIPIGSGMGSSAALAVSIAGAVALFLEEKLDREKINEIAFLSEQKKHGHPSGGDNAVCCSGGLIWYRKESPELKIIKPLPFSLPEKLAQNFVVIQTGVPDESTGEMVSMVRNLYQQKPELAESILSSQEKLVRELLPAIKSENESELMRIIKAGEKNLESIGVVSESTKLFIREIEKMGAAAKISGAGGRTRASGIVLAYYKEKMVIEKLAKLHGFMYADVSLGTEGVRREL